jgi:hypothetical protein
MFVRRVSSAIVAVVIAAGTVARSQSDPATISAARETLTKWVETQQIISKEKRDWQTGKELLAQRIRMIQGEIVATESKIAETRSAMGESDRNRRTVVEKNDNLQSATSALADSISAAEAKTRQLLKLLPEPLAMRLAPLAGRLPAVGDPPQATLSERWQNVIGILNEVNKFSRDVTVASEIRELSSGAKAEVQTIYLGLAQGYYVTAKGDAAGVGRPSADGWSWVAMDALAPEISHVLAILKNEKVPAYVSLPVEIR